MKLTFDLANRDQANAGLSISAREFLELEGVCRAAARGPKAVEELACPERFEKALKNLVVALLNADPEEAGVWAKVLTKQVGSRIAHRAFERLRDNNAKALASWTWKEPIKWESPSSAQQRQKAKTEVTNADLRGGRKQIP
jgi:hypothetical protein